MLRPERAPSSNGRGRSSPLPLCRELFVSPEMAKCALQIVRQIALLEGGVKSGKT